MSHMAYNDVSPLCYMLIWGVCLGAPTRYCPLESIGVLTQTTANTRIQYAGHMVLSRGDPLRQS